MLWGLLAPNLLSGRQLVCRPLEAAMISPRLCPYTTGPVKVHFDNQSVQNINAPPIHPHTSSRPPTPPHPAACRGRFRLDASADPSLLKRVHEELAELESEAQV